MRFSATIRYWRPEQRSGLAVVDIPAERIKGLGGLKQQRVRGSINGAAYQSNVMPAGSGRLALSVSKKMMADAGAAVGDTISLEVIPIANNEPK